MSSSKQTKETKRSGIDYSKWDHLDEYEEDTDDDSNHTDTNPDEYEVNEIHNSNKTKAPHVLRLDIPSSITYQPSDETWAIHPTTSLQATTPSPTPTTSSSTNTAVTKDKQMDALILNGSAYFDPIHKVQTYWCQNRYQVILSIGFDSKVIPSSSIRVQTTGLVSYTNRFSAVGTLQDKGTVSICYYKNKDTSTILLEGTLPHFVHYPESQQDHDDENEQVDWEITPYPIITETNNTMRLIRITLNKAVPMAGLIVWWTKPLNHFPDIELQDITSRTSADTNTSNKMKEAWDEAHRLFQEKIKNKKDHNKDTLVSI